MNMTRQNIGKYEILKRLGKGGMGVVYKALHPVIGKVVAVKVLQPSEAMEITIGPDRLEQIFLAEAQILANLQHPHLTSIWDYDRDEENRPFFVMDYICNNLGMMIGESFQLERASRPIRPNKVIHYGTQLLEVLAYLHHHQVIHRDVKPHNILVTDNDTIMLCDFGMALADGISFSGPDNMQIGSPYYTPPEQKKTPHQVDGRADCYSVAVLLYRMLTGTLPGMQSFPLSLIDDAYDRRWDDFFHIGLQWDPVHRFPDARTMQDELSALKIAPRHTPKQRQEAEASPEPPRSVLLRNTPENLCGKRALKRFQLNELARPMVRVTNDFTEQDDIIIDHATNLAWRRLPCPYPLVWSAAFSFCESLSATNHNHPWRLPTVTELLSLLDDAAIPHLVPIFANIGAWFWTSDQHGRSEYWIVNLDMGYAAPQDRDCRSYVRAVCNLPELKA